MPFTQPSERHFLFLSTCSGTPTFRSRMATAGYSRTATISAILGHPLSGTLFRNTHHFKSPAAVLGHPLSVLGRPPLAILGQPLFRLFWDTHFLFWGTHHFKCFFEMMAVLKAMFEMMGVPEGELNRQINRLRVSGCAALCRGL